MRVKLLLLGVAYFVSIFVKSDATNKCYRAKICIHDGKEKCGQDVMKGEVRRFLDSCDMKEYNCLKDANFVKTNNKHCWKLPSINKKPVADEKINDDGENINEVNINESKYIDDDEQANGASNVGADLEESKEDRAVQTTEEVGNYGASKEGKDYTESKENAPWEENELDEADEVNRGEEDDEEEGEVNANGASKEDSVNKASEEDGTSGVINMNQSNNGDDINEAVGVSKIDVADESNNEKKSKNAANEACKFYKSDGTRKIMKKMTLIKKIKHLKKE